MNVSATYKRMYDDMKNGGASKYSAEDKKHITEFVERADLFHPQHQPAPPHTASDHEVDCGVPARLP